MSTILYIYIRRFIEQKMFKLLFLLIVVTGVLAQEECFDDYKIHQNNRVMDIMSAEHLDEILGEVPDSFRPYSVILFENNANTYEGWDEFVNQLPQREQVMVGRYHVEKNDKFHWYAFTPEMNLTARYGVTSFPTIVFVPPYCKGETEWCVREVVDNLQIMGCEDYKTDCTSKDVFKWVPGGDRTPLDVWGVIADMYGQVPLNPRFRTYDDQRNWLNNRDRTTIDNQLRGFAFPLKIKNFTKLGFEVRETPKEFQEWLVNFYEREKDQGVIENWDEGSATQINFHEYKTVMYNLDKVYREKEYYANTYIKPILEEWSGIKLKQTSFYGIRCYPEGSILKAHIDR